MLPLLWPCVPVLAGPSGHFAQSPVQFFDQPFGGVWVEASPSPSATSTFDWEALEDPSRPEFWGGEVPPAPFVALAQSQRPEDAIRVRAWLERRLDLDRQVMRLLYPDRFGAEASGPATPPPGPRPSLTADPSWATTTVLFVYAAGCGFCRQAVPVLEALEHRGARVVPLHVDVPLPAFAGRSRPYSAEMKATLPIEVTPTVVLVRNGQRAVVQGFGDLEARLTHAHRALGAPDPARLP